VPQSESRTAPLAFAVLAMVAAFSLGDPANAAGKARPDFSGVWRMARPAEITDERQRTPAIPAPPLTPEGAAAYAADREAYRKSEEEGRPIARDREVCIPDGMPRMLTTDLPFEIIQTPKRITLITEFMAQIRRIALDRTKHAKSEDAVDTFFGDSIGRWEGDTLVVETTGLKPRVKLFNDVPRSDQLRIVERIRLVTPNILRDEVTIIDPKVLTKPWTVVRVFQRRPDLAVGEFVCTENNRNYRDAQGRLGTRMP